MNGVLFSVIFQVSPSRTGPVSVYFTEVKLIVLACAWSGVPAIVAKPLGAAPAAISATVKLAASTREMVSVAVVAVVVTPTLKVPTGIFAAGSVAGAFRLDEVKAQGAHAGWAAAKHAGSTSAEPPAPAVTPDSNQTHPWPIFPGEKGPSFVDFDEDLKYEDLINGIADGFDNVELLKRYSTVGMGGEDHLTLGELLKQGWKPARSSTRVAR